MRSHPTDNTSTTWLGRLTAREPAAWERLLELYGPLVHTWCRRKDLTEDESRDVLQDVFTAVAKGIDTFRHETSSDTFRGWLRVVAKHKIVDIKRRRAGRGAGGTTAMQRLQESPLEAETGDLDEADERTLIVRQALQLMQSEFETTTWQAFWEVAVNGKTSTEAAASLGITAGAVRTSKWRVLKRLRDEFAGLEDFFDSM